MEVKKECKDSDLIGLNIGGIIYKTTRGTLIGKSEEPNYFSTLLSNNFTPVLDSNGDI